MNHVIRKPDFCLCKNKISYAVCIAIHVISPYFGGISLFLRESPYLDLSFSYISYTSLYLGFQISLPKFYFSFFVKSFSLFGKGNLPLCHLRCITCMCTADQRLVFASWVVQFIFFLNPNFKLVAIFCSCKGRFASDLVGNTDDWLSRVTAHFISQHIISYNNPLYLRGAFGKFE